MPCVLDVTIDGEFYDFHDDGGEYYTYENRLWHVRDGRLYRVGN